MVNINQFLLETVKCWEKQIVSTQAQLFSISEQNNQILTIANDFLTQMFLLHERIFSGQQPLMSTSITQLKDLWVKQSVDSHNADATQWLLIHFHC